MKYIQRSNRSGNLIISTFAVLLVFLLLMNVLRPDQSRAEQEAPARLKIVVVRPEIVLGSLGETFDIMKAFDAADAELDNELKSQREKLIETPPVGSIVKFNNELVKRSAQLEGLEKTIQIRREQNARLRDTQLRLIKSRIENAIEEIARKEGYSLVLKHENYRVEPPRARNLAGDVLWASLDIDISDAVILKMNNEYKRAPAGK